MASLNQTNISRQSVHLWIYFFCLCLLVIAMPTSRTLISSSQIFLGVNWLAEGNYLNKLKKFYNNKPAVAIALIYMLYVVGLLWTENLSYGIGYELKNKLPILTLTFVVASSPALDKKKIRALLFLFIATVLFVSFIGLFTYLTNELTDFRHISPFASQLYFSMMLIISAFLLPWLIKQTTKNKYWLAISFVLSAWMIFFIFLSRSLSGLVSLAGVLLFLLIWIVVEHKSLFLKITAISIFFLSVAFTTWLLTYMHNLTTYKTDVDFSSLDMMTQDGKPYLHDTTHYLRENGHLVYLYISEEELKGQWKEVSEIDYYGEDRQKHEIRHTLFRYMASMGYRKDRKHLKLLSEEDISAIEKGTTNYLYNHWPGIFVRVHQTMMGIQIYRDTKDPNWSTLTMRADLWRASFQALKRKPLIGWGTGDIYKAVDYGLEKNNSKLEFQQAKPHNQYLLLLISLGVVGFILFFVFYVYAVIKTKAYKILPFNLFLVVFAVDMMGNNPIDAQYGITLFVFFTLLFGIIYRNTSYDIGKHNRIHENDMKHS